ncbi:C39 family peptidase [Paenibacillus sp. PR3]|uniref:C39 family peptidase n=1 Tax=Paenibacillus terricola TaxID=2763503 RepID=A0ABR8N2N9_9BACL|nr:C39 family peptidase [Paenibacillus terricola]MBD3922421.1 C39 family peptidase [Paenibacillus terricola]
MPDASIPPIPDCVLGLDPGTFVQAVQQLQSRLNELGYCGSTNKPLIADGKFGPNTLFAVNAFKTINKLGNTGSSAGKIGPQSWKVLFCSDVLDASGHKPADNPYPAKPPVYYSQEDPQWKGIMYSNHRDPKQNIGTSGCGPTCMAMVITNLKGTVVLPPETAQFSLDHGFRSYDDGTEWGYYGSISARYGLKCVQTAVWDDVKQALNEPRRMAIASMRPGHFTQGGHYIVLHDFLNRPNDGWVDVLDPNQDNQSYFRRGHDGLVDEGKQDDGRVTAKESVFRQEAGQFWIFNL